MKSTRSKGETEFLFESQHDTGDRIVRVFGGAAGYDGAEYVLLMLRIRSRYGFFFLSK